MHNKGSLTSWLGRKSFGVGLSPWQHPWCLYVPGYPEWCLPGFSSFLGPLSKPSGTSTVCHRLRGTGPHGLKSLLSPCSGCPWCYDEPNDTVSSWLSQNSQAHTQKPSSSVSPSLSRVPVPLIRVELSGWMKAVVSVSWRRLFRPAPRTALVPLVCGLFLCYDILSSMAFVGKPYTQNRKLCSMFVNWKGFFLF